MLQQKGKKKEKFICIPEKNISGECTPKQLSAYLSGWRADMNEPRQKIEF